MESTSKIRERKCTVCKSHYLPERPGMKVCSSDCAVRWVEIQREKLERKRLRERRQEFLDNDRSYHLKKAQEAFNAYIRERDAGKPCVSCGRYHQGQYHAGHYRPVGSHPELRFNEINCHRQCSACNSHKSGNLIDYRKELIRRIGEPLVEWLERDHPKPQKWTIDELKKLAAYYREQRKMLSQHPESEEY